MTQIVIHTAGSLGDTLPYVALGRGLKAAGYDVTIAAMENFGDLVTSNQLSYHAIPGDFAKILAEQNILASGMRPADIPALLRFFRTGLGPIMRDIGDALWAASQNADAVISALPLLSYEIATTLSVPYFQASLFPFARTRAFPQPFIPLPVPRFLNRLTFIFGEQAAWGMFRRIINQWRQETLGIAPAPFFGEFNQVDAARIPTLYGFSPHLVPPPPDWGDNIHVTGYWLLHDDADWRPPSALRAFLASGPPPVFVGFGSMPETDPNATTRLIIDAFAEAGVRGILSSGWSGLGADDLPDSVYLLDYAPYEWLFPQMAMVVHHGGAGSTGQGLRAGVPSLVVPFQGDQFFWGRRIHEQGIGPPPLPRRRLSAARLAAVIRTTLADQSMRDQATLLGETARAEDGIARAVEIVINSIS